MIIMPSLLSADYLMIGEELKKIEQAGFRWLHFDVMDGQFVPNITFGAGLVKTIAEQSTLLLDVHLMVERPENMLEDFIKAGAHNITVHAESTVHLDKTIRSIKDAGLKAGVALNPATPLNVLDHILGEVDWVLLLTVNPGFGGQALLSYIYKKIHALRLKIQEEGIKTQIQIDGGVNKDTIKKLHNNGAEIFVAGSALFYPKDHTISENHRMLMSELPALESGCGIGIF